MILLLIAVSAALNAWTLHDGHNWGGDFAQYLIHAANIMSGKPYTDGIMIEKILVYPPGFPLLLAPLLDTFGRHFAMLKSLNLLFWYATVYLLYVLFLPQLGKKKALLGCSVLLFSSFFFVFKQNILSDVPFMFFCTAFLFCAQRRLWLAASVLLFYAVLTRSAGLALAGSALFYYLFMERRPIMAVVTAAATMLALGVTLLMTGGLHSGFWRTFLDSPMATAWKLLTGSCTPWQALVWVYAPGQTTATSWIFTGLEGLGIVLSPVLYLLAGFWFVRKTRARTLSLPECFVFIYLGLLALWSTFGDSAQNFARFTLPVSGWIWLWTVGSARWMKWLAALLLAVNLINTAWIFRFNDDELFQKPNQELFAWIKEHASDEAKYMLWEPRTVALMTDKVGTTLAWLRFNPTDRWHDICRAWNVRYVAVNPIADRFFIDGFNRRPWAKLIWRNRMYWIFEISG